MGLELVPGEDEVEEGYRGEILQGESEKEADELHGEECACYGVQLHEKLALAQGDQGGIYVEELQAYEPDEERPQDVIDRLQVEAEDEVPIALAPRAEPSAE